MDSRSFRSNYYKDPAALFAAFREGDRRAFNHFYELHNQSIYWILIKIIKDPEEVMDIVSNSFVKLFRGRENINDADHLVRYLFIVARNEAIDYLRKRKVRRKAQDELAQNADLEYKEPLESEIVYAILMEKISLVVQSLPESRKQIFELHFKSDMDTRAIAIQLNIAEQTVRNQLSRAIIQIREALHQIAALL